MKTQHNARATYSQESESLRLTDLLPTKKGGGTACYRWTKSGQRQAERRRDGRWTGESRPLGPRNQGLQGNNPGHLSHVPTFSGMLAMVMKCNLNLKFIIFVAFSLFF